LKELGQWAGLYKIDAEEPRKVVDCSCVAIKSWGQETQARQIVVQETKKGWVELGYLCYSYMCRSSSS